jgi:nucleotide-binding universal stress UspA family protein
MTKLLAAVDNSAACGPVISSARILAPVLGAEVEAVHVSEDDGNTARASADALGVPLRTVRGDPLEQLLALIARDDVVGAAIGVRGLPGGHRALGHLAVELADRSEKPSLVVPPETQPPEELRRVLIAMEGTASRPRRLKHALQLVEDLGLEVVVVHVDDEHSIPSFSDQVQHETDAYADAFLAQYASGLQRSQLELRIGEPADEILAAAAERGVDMIAMGWPSGAGPEHGMVSRQVAQRSPTPTLLVPVG